MWEYLIVDAVSAPVETGEPFRLPRLSPADEQEIVAPLADLGKQGWELCSIVRISDRCCCFYFKRPLVELRGT